MLVKALVNHIFINKQIFFTMCTIPQQIHHISMMDTSQQLCLSFKFFNPLSWATQQFLHSYFFSISQLPLQTSHIPRNKNQVLSPTHTFVHQIKSFFFYPSEVINSHPACFTPAQTFQCFRLYTNYHSILVPKQKKMIQILKKQSNLNHET